ncbi:MULTISPECIES: GNAT family N-acetyltransferase [unclassified Lysobacter]|uniref:GNAT family N-acetyltransferase n=1 Tax=unclassified Lysobacter TaxID=2635362 RepID=UPI0006FC4B2B|nr:MULTISPECIES: GNAT family N-acetyltransferase [unclassified Lysobacter]KRA16915.1 acetyltransferase [Lysobacter sp. Root604]KRD73922.1 acetyltransferase [Lysobacter sp. Root983]
MQIRAGELDHPEVIALLREHLQGMAQLSPPESIHALDLDGLRRPEISFWSAWRDGQLLGCGALKQLDAGHGEIKSMRTVSRHLRKGVAAAMLDHLIDEAGRRAYRRLSLETGSMDGFEPARRLYARYGFEPCGPFADYVDDPNSVFMSKHL